jgi:hypothetical protein
VSIGEFGERGSSSIKDILALIMCSAMAAFCMSPARADYTPVSPCRIVDTRYTTDGAMAPRETRKFRVYGDISSQNQGGGGAPGDYPTFCAGPGGVPTAVHINVTVVPGGPRGQSGWAAVWPADKAQPNASWLNYVAGTQNIANAGTVATSAGDAMISVQTLRSTQVIIDVLGYFD